jgi:hypothetical protein
LTPNHRNILRLLIEAATGGLADEEADDGGGGGGAGAGSGTGAGGSNAGGVGVAVPFATLLEAGTTTMVVSTAAALRAQLGELADHGIVEVRGGSVALKLPRAAVEAALNAAVAMM